MKKLMIAFAIAGTISITSCNKNWTCQCIQQDGTTASTPINGGTFYHAKHNCHSMSNSSQNCSLLTEEK